jgi:hypothetical protein
MTPLPTEAWLLVVSMCSSTPAHPPYPPQLVCQTHVFDEFTTLAACEQSKLKLLTTNTNGNRYWCAPQALTEEEKLRVPDVPREMPTPPHELDMQHHDEN